MSYLARLKALNSEKRDPRELQKVQEGAFCSSCTTQGGRFSEIEPPSAASPPPTGLPGSRPVARPLPELREHALVRWLVEHPPPVTDPNVCAHCRRPESRDAVLLPYGPAADGRHSWVHARCWPEWHLARRLQAERALDAARVGTGPKSAA